MKKSLVLGVLLLFSVSLWAENPDYIFTNSSINPKIMAKVNVVTDYEVVYTEWNDSNEKIKTITLDKVKGIIYANGEKEVFNLTKQELENKLTPQDKQNEALLTVQKEQHEKNVAKSENVKDNLLTQVGSMYFKGGLPISKSECLEIMKRDCPIAYQQFYNSNKKANGAWTTFGISIGLDAVVGGLLIGLAYTCPDPEAATIAGTVFTVIGSIGTLVSLPIACIQTAKRNDALSIYNDYIVAEKTSELRLQANNDGSVGLALTF